MSSVSEDLSSIEEVEQASQHLKEVMAASGDFTLTTALDFERNRSTLLALKDFVSGIDRSYGF